MTNRSSKLLIVSVGGSPQPIIYSLNQQQPDYIVYFCSRDSRAVVRRQIEPALTFTACDHDFIVTPDEQNLLQSVKILLDRLPQLLLDWQLDAPELVADYTGGTKTMSAALVLALVNKGAVYSYVGGLERNRQGLGVVIDGREQMLHVQNPWDVLAIESLRDMRHLFNRCRYRAVGEIAARTAAHVVENRSFFKALQYIADGFYQWDNFLYKKSLDKLKRGESQLRPFVEGHPAAALRRFHQQVAACLPRLESILTDTIMFKPNLSRKDIAAATGADGQAIIHDLLANAVRRAEIEYKYDDAVARLYSAIEKVAKVRLLLGFNVNNSALDLRQLPEACRAAVHQGGAADEEPVKLPLHRSFALLASLEDPVGLAYQIRQAELEKVLSIRNGSLLAHGFDPVTQSTYEKMLNIALAFIGVSKENLPIFPQLEWQGEGQG